MIQLARHTTIESQRLAAGRRTGPVGIWLAVVGTGALLLLSHLALTALHNGHSGAAGVLALLAALAGVFSGLATRASLARLGWLGLPHPLVRRTEFKSQIQSVQIAAWIPLISRPVLNC